MSGESRESAHRRLVAEATFRAAGVDRTNVIIYLTDEVQPYADPAREFAADHFFDLENPRDVVSLTDICIDHMFICMRTTLDIDDTLLKKAKAHARQTQRTLTGVIEEALRQTLTGTPPAGAPPAHQLTLKTVKGALLPGVDISDRDSLYERMEGRS